MPIQMIFLIVLLVVAATAAVAAFNARRQRAAVLGRIMGTGPAAAPAVLLAEPGSGRLGAIGAWLLGLLPAWLVRPQSADQTLAQAGFESRLAPVWYAASQLLLGAMALSLILPMLAGASFTKMVLAAVAALAVGVLAPRAYVAHRRGERQGRIRKALPDALDMILVCVEAGVSIDAAILRVGREMAIAHPDISDELLIVNRRQNAGMSREDALRGMYDRTGVDEVRSLVSSIVQTERWGTSIARTLRVNADALRRKRREAAQRRAALISLKMVFPLALLILPPLMAIILGPAYLAIVGAFNAISH